MKQALKTLIVDDSRAVLSMMEGMLNYYGIETVDKAANGQLAVEQFQEALSTGAPYNLVFLDIVMPVMDGQTALRQMRAAEAAAGVTGEKRATIIMATSLSSTTDMVDALIDGDCTDYLIKPFEVDDVLGMLIKHGLVDATCRQ
jgi:two-component system chemotaxis response regulator CheY